MDAVSGRCWGDVEAIGDLCGVIEMFMQGVDVFENAAAPADDEIVNGNDVLGVFREGNPTNMLERANLVVSTYLSHSNPALASLSTVIGDSPPDAAECGTSPPLT